jgi:hypothetical protein
MNKRIGRIIGIDFGASNSVVCCEHFPDAALAGDAQLLKRVLLNGVRVAEPTLLSISKPRLFALAEGWESQTQASRNRSLDTAQNEYAEVLTKLTAQASVFFAGRFGDDTACHGLSQATEHLLPKPAAVPIPPLATDFFGRLEKTIRALHPH